MNIYENVPDNKQIFDNPIVTIGNFDGVHLGHRQIFKKLLEKSKEKSDIVITFRNHPKSILYPEHDFQYLTTLEEKIEEIKNLGISNLIILDFDKDMSQMSPYRFIKELLIDKIGIDGIVMGYDHSFGHKREGNIDNLMNMSEDNYKIYRVSPHIVDDHPVSSTRIRNCLLDGKTYNASILLGRKYYINGFVVRGEQRGRKMGFPTANIGLINKNKVIPQDGVYAAKITINNDKKQYCGMLNIGQNPTFGNTNKTVEMNIFDFDANIYDKQVKVDIYKKMRDEEKFSGMDELKKKLLMDKRQIAEFFQNEEL